MIARFPEIYPGLLESTGDAGRFDILPMSSGECLELGALSGLTGPHAGAGGFLDALDRWWRAEREVTDPERATDTECAADTERAAELESAAEARGSRAAPAAGPDRPSTQSDSAVELPFSGGWLVYLGYELAAEIEPCLSLPASVDSVRALAIRAPAAWIRDHASGQAWLVAERGSSGLLEAFERHVSELKDCASNADVGRGRCRDSEIGGEPVVARFDIREEDSQQFLDAVRQSLAYIAAGEVYQVNLSRQWQVDCAEPVDPVAVYERLRRANPSPFAALLRYRGFSVMSSSPERLLSMRNGCLATRPIAGTRPRGQSPDRDAALIESLLGSEKERAEHVMLIDLERNDLGRVCMGGSVRVDEYMSVETYAHVHHIVSNVSGRLRAEVSPVQVIRALFPGGTITGCPKIRCMAIIAELEKTGRGAYTGSIGYLNRDGSGDFNILIRTLTADEGASAALTFRAGAGIVADSNPLQELAETRAKAAGLLRALETL